MGDIAHIITRSRVVFVNTTYKMLQKNTRLTTASQKGGVYFTQGAILRESAVKR